MDKDLKKETLENNLLVKKIAITAEHFDYYIDNTQEKNLKIVNNQLAFLAGASKKASTSSDEHLESYYVTLSKEEINQLIWDLEELKLYYNC